jgi:hypothetical protein
MVIQSFYVDTMCILVRVQRLLASISPCAQTRMAQDLTYRGSISCSSNIPNPKVHRDPKKGYVLPGPSQGLQASPGPMASLALLLAALRGPAGPPLLGPPRSRRRRPRGRDAVAPRRGRGGRGDLGRGAAAGGRTVAALGTGGSGTKGGATEATGGISVTWWVGELDFFGWGRWGLGRL